MAMQMMKSDIRTQLRIKVNIRPGPVSPVQKTAWRKFWQKLISEVKAGERQ